MTLYNSIVKLQVNTLTIISESILHIMKRRSSLLRVYLHVHDYL